MQLGRRYGNVRLEAACAARPNLTLDKQILAEAATGKLLSPSRRRACIDRRSGSGSRSGGPAGRSSAPPSGASPRASVSDHSRSAPPASAPQAGESVSESLRPSAPGAIRTAPDAPHSL